MSKPLRHAEVEDDPNWLLIAPDGVYREVDVSMEEEQFQQMWAGYMCAWCYEPWATAWPKKCTLPGCWSPDPITEEVQRRYLTERFGGEKWFGPSKATVASWDNAIDKHNEKKKSDRIWIPVPKDVT